MSNQIISSDGEIIEPNPGTDMSLAVGLTRAEIDSQIATARAYPRSIKRATDTILSLATLDEETSEECMYALPRGGKPIQGPSIRLAEIIQQSWGNNRVAARVVAVDRVEKFVEAEGVYHDLETNSATMARVRRRISGKNGQILTDDMIIVTGNAACSIAKRNAILGGVPKPVWRRAYEAAQRVIAGTTETLTVTRDRSLKAFANFGVKPEQIFVALGVGGLDDIGLDLIPTLRGMFSTLKNGEATVEEMFAPKAAPGSTKSQGEALAAKLAARQDKPAQGFNEADVRREIDGDAHNDAASHVDATNALAASEPTGKVIEAKAQPQTPAIDVETLIADARSASMGGRREFDAWFLSRTPDERAALEPEMKGLMAAAHAVDHPKKAQPAPEPEPEAKAEPDAAPADAGPAFDFDAELEAFTGFLATFTAEAELGAFASRLQNDKASWLNHAPQHVKDEAAERYGDTLAEVRKFEKATKVKAEQDAKTATKAAERAAPPTAEPSPLDELRKTGSSAAIQGVRKYKLWRGKLNEQQFQALNGSALDAELMELAKKSDEDL